MGAWENIAEILQQRLDHDDYHSWFRRIEFITQDRHALHVRVPDARFHDWINGHLDELLAAAHAANAGDIQVVYVTERSLPSPCSNEADILNPKRTFKDFVVGRSNKFAHATATAVATETASADPLFLYGGVGLGKTHLLHAIGHEIRRWKCQTTVRYLPAERFARELADAAREDRLARFRDYYRNCEVLLVDDLQFALVDRRAQEELAQLLDSLHETQKRVVITADRPLRDVPELIPRLQRCLTWGVIADIQAPDLETKLAIIRKKGEERGVQIPDNVARYVGSSLNSGIRELEGAVLRIIAFCNMLKTPPTLDIAQDALEDVLPPPDKLVTIDRVQRNVAEHFHVSVQDLKSKTKVKSLQTARQLSMYLCKELTHHSLPSIGRAFGGRHHTTVLHAVSKIERERRLSRALGRLIHDLEDSLR